MNAEFFSAIADIEKEKGIPKEYMLDRINQALLAALRKDNPEAENNVFVDVDEAKKKIKKMDKDRAKYYRSVTGMEWGDARTYDLCLNTSLLGIEKSCDLVEHAVRIFLQSRGIDPDANQEE